MKRKAARHYWDARLKFARHLGATLGLADVKPGIAWDTYLLYGRGDVAVEEPTFWMHQLQTDVAPRLDVEELRTRIRALLRG
jgi:hypothetical protein